MGGWTLVFRSLDALTLTAVFLFQNVVLNLILIRGMDESVWPFFWFLADFVGLVTFYVTLYVVGCHYHQEKKRQRKADSASAALSAAHQAKGDGDVSSVEGCIVGEVPRGREPPTRPISRLSNNRRYYPRSSESTSTYKKNSFMGTFTKNFPMAYVSWILYSGILIAKIGLLFESGIAQRLSKEDFFGPQMLKFAIGISALIFSLLVAAHKNARSDPMRNAYLYNLCYRIALEILDSASFLSLLLPSESHLVYPFLLEDVILVLASINLFLPCMTLYKLCATDFGRKVAYPVETWYKFIHVILVDGTFFAVRLFLWGMYSTDTSIFIIKNLYALLNFGRELRGDFTDCRTFCCERKPEDEVELGGRGMRSTLRIGEGDEEVDDDDDASLFSLGGFGIGLRNLNRDRLGRFGYLGRKKEGSISTRGIHGSAQSSLIHVYAINSDTSNGHAGTGTGAAPTTTTTPAAGVDAVDDSNSQLDLDEDTTSLVTQDADGDTRTQASASLGSTATSASSATTPQNQLDEVPVRLRGQGQGHNATGGQH